MDMNSKINGEQPKKRKPRKSVDERIAETDKTLKEYEEKVKILENRRKALVAKQKKEERDKRTHRLCIVGGVVEKALGEHLTDEQCKRFEELLTGDENTMRKFKDAMNATAANATAATANATTANATAANATAANAATANATTANAATANATTAKSVTPLEKIAAMQNSDYEERGNV